MKRVVIFLGAMLLATVLLPSGLTPPLAASATTTYSFNLDPPNTAKAEGGATIRVTGSGTFTFDTEGAGSVVASGSFTEFNKNGSVFARGTWQATAFTSFWAFGGPNPGIQGGQLKITVTLFPDGGPPVTGVSMIVNCRVFASVVGFTEEEGTADGVFTERTGGATLFHLDN